MTRTHTNIHMHTHKYKHKVTMHTPTGRDGETHIHTHTKQQNHIHRWCDTYTYIHKHKITCIHPQGEMVSKMGDRALPDVIPILQHSLDSPDTSQRAGVCLGLAEVIQNCQKQQVCLCARAWIPVNISIDFANIAHTVPIEMRAQNVTICAHVP